LGVLISPTGADAHVHLKKHHHHGHHHHRNSKLEGAQGNATSERRGGWKPVSIKMVNSGSTPRVLSSEQSVSSSQQNDSKNSGEKMLREMQDADAQDAGEKSDVQEDPDDQPAKVSESKIMSKVHSLENELVRKEEAVKGAVSKGRIVVNGPLPADFKDRFAQAVAAATSCDPSEVRVLETNEVATMFLQTSSTGAPVVEVVFEAPSQVTAAVEEQSADPDSKLATGSMKSFLVAKADDFDDSEDDDSDFATPVQEKGIDVDGEMPYGELEPFGREDTAQELTEASVRESDEMVDQLERAEVAEEKRSVFRALTRLRGAAITSFDGIARAQTGNIDEYNKFHKWRKAHPLHHLADEESDITKWAFPDDAD
jgi:hypothetical protein